MNCVIYAKQKGRRLINVFCYQSVIGFAQRMCGHKMMLQRRCRSAWAEPALGVHLPQLENERVTNCSNFVVIVLDFFYMMVIHNRYRIAKLLRRFFSVTQCLFK